MKDDNESYMHYYAKLTAVNWFRDSEKRFSEDNRKTFYTFDWVFDRDRQTGVMMEYPIYSGGEGVAPPWRAYPNKQEAPQMILDIAIISEGRVKYAVEVVHKHPCTKMKRETLEKYGIKLFEISATWILDQVRKPNKIIFFLE
jgi:hypothetical protein